MAISTVDIPKRNLIIHSLFLFLCTFIGPCSLSLLGTALPDLICIMNIDLKSASSLFFVYGFGKCVTCIIGIFVKDRLDVTLSMVVALAITAVLLNVVPNSTFLPLTMGVFVISGCCSGIFNIGRFKLVSIIWSKSNWGYHFISSGVAIASLTTPLFACLFVDGQYQRHEHLDSNVTALNEFQSVCETNIHFAYMILSVFALFVAVGFVANHYSLINRDITLDLATSGESLTKYANKPLTVVAFAILLSCMFGTITASMTSVFSLMVTFGLRSELHLDVKTASAVTSLFSICLLCSRICCIFIADRVKPCVLLWTSLIVVQTASIVFIIYKDSSLAMLWLITAVRGVGTGPIFSSLLTWTRTHVTLSSRLICIILVLDNIGNLIHPTLTGILMDLFGPNMFIYTTAATRFLQLVLFGLLNILAYNLTSGERYDSLQSSSP